MEIPKPLIEMILGMIELYDKDKVLSPSDKYKMAYCLAAFNANATVKFIKGQKEHGGKLSDRQLDNEIYMETIDLFWYNSAKAWDVLPTK